MAKAAEGCRKRIKCGCLGFFGFFSDLETRMSDPSLDAIIMTVSQDELEFLDILSPLMGDTPRTVKRFVNLYQLVRVVFQSSTHTRNNSDAVEDYKKLAFILAIADGLPHLAPDLIATLVKTTDENSLKNVFESISADKFPEEHHSLSNWLNQQLEFQRIPAIEFFDIIKTAQRFLFRTGINDEPKQE